jgi:hypothetical protein
MKHRPGGSTLTAPDVATKPAGTARRGFGATLRLDRWIIQPAFVGLVFTVFIVYTTISALFLIPQFGVPFEADGYLSPFFSPLILPGLLPGWFSPAILILWIPLGFRTTCYYYRKAYYRSFFADPPACAVGEPTIHRRYSGETRFPFIFQNLHRFFLYLAFIPLAFLWLDALLSVRYDGGWRIGLGVVLLTVNAVLLTGYSLSCHSLRHLVGGRIDCFSCTARTRTRYTLWQRLTRLNRNHATYAWASLFSVMFADMYVRMLGLGWISDISIRF